MGWLLRFKERAKRAALISKLIPIWRVSLVGRTGATPTMRRRCAFSILLRAPFDEG